MISGEYERPAQTEPSVVGIGNFDGVHLGHQALIAQVTEIANEKSLFPTLVTFSPHPVKLLYPQKKLKELYPLEELYGVLEGLGIKQLVIYKFDLAFSQLSPEHFIMDYIVRPMSACHMVVGYDFAFGANRSGTKKIIETLGSQYGFNCTSIPAVTLDGAPISSTRIREALTSGDVADVSKYLGRAYVLHGVIVRGRGRGHKIGFPTANMRTQSELVPRVGVYATKMKVEGQEFESVTNIGFNPTFNSSDASEVTQTLTIETHLLNEDKDLYGKHVSVFFYKRLRDEISFPSVKALVDQIKQDVRSTKEYFIQEER